MTMTIPFPPKPLTKALVTLSLRLILNVGNPFEAPRLVQYPFEQSSNGAVIKRTAVDSHHSRKHFFFPVRLVDWLSQPTLGQADLSNLLGAARQEAYDLHIEPVDLASRRTDASALLG
jgi:hypothetical protein